VPAADEHVVRGTDIVRTTTSLCGVGTFIRSVTRMSRQAHNAGGILGGIWLSLSLISVAAGQPQLAASSAVHEDPVVTMRAGGTFQVKLTPQAPEDTADATLGRLTLVKQFQGDLEGSSRGQMLTAMTPTEGSAGYVAMERVRGTLQGRAGTFALQHSGTMARGKQQLTVAVVPDSGTGDLIGLAGQMVITIADGKHSYEFEYTLPAGS
jgi:hypothetical protein